MMHAIVAGKQGSCDWDVHNEGDSKGDAIRGRGLRTPFRGSKRRGVLGEYMWCKPLWRRDWHPILGPIISTSLWVALSATQAWVGRLSATILKSAAYYNWKWSQARGRSSLVPLASSLCFSLQFSAAWDNSASSPKPTFSLCLHLRK